MMIILYRLIGAVALALAMAGVILPGLPATPFALVAAWAFARGAPALAVRLESHRHLGPLLRNWRQRRAVPRSAKILAVSSMAVSFALLYARLDNPFLLAALAAVLLSVAIYLLSRPTA
jgi:uncharacterized membrane protein YbaN (DUF454 family)